MTARRDGAVALAALGLLLLWERSGLDLVVSGWFADAGGFAWRDAWWAQAVLHDGVRGLAGVVLAVLAVDAWRLLWPGPPRAQRLYWLGVTLACLLLVPALKHWSRTSCPWDLAPFGGHYPYVPHWRWNVADGGPGECFPSGHAVAAFAFLGTYCLWRPYRPVAARRWLAAVMVAGAAAGAAQVVRGAHFVSHVLWSAWLCWTICTLADRAAAVRRVAGAPR